MLGDDVRIGSPSERMDTHVKTCNVVTQVLILVLCSVFVRARNDSCSPYNYSQSKTAQAEQDTQQHTTGYHEAYLAGYADRAYSGYPGELCDVGVTASGDFESEMYEEGIITASEHTAAIGYFNATANGPSPQSATEVTVGAVRSCLLPPCSFGVSVAFPPVVITYSPPNSALWSNQQTAAFTCKAENGGVCTPQQCGPKYIWDPELCACEYVGGSPILIDTRSVGFKLSKPSKGGNGEPKTCAEFDLRGDGQMECWSWPEVGSGNGWLALDRNHNGRIDSGKELFGNYTEQPDSKNKNGYDALMQFALIQNGGFTNPDGTPNYILDDRDLVWKRLVIWIPEDYSGVSKPYELHKLSEFGIHSISLIPALYKKTDQWGNTFKYGAPLNIPASEARDWQSKNNSRLKKVTPHELDVQTYDVWLVNSDIGK